MSTLKRTLSLFVAVLVMTAPGRAATCEVSTSGTAFGAYESIRAGDRDTSGTLSVTCSGVPGEAVSYSIQLSAGGGTYANRKLSGPGTALSYNLYTDGARSQIWGMAAMAPLSSPTATHFRFLQPHAVTPSTAASREVRLKWLPACTATVSWLHWPTKGEPLSRVFRVHAVCRPRQETAWRKKGNQMLSRSWVSPTSVGSATATKLSSSGGLRRRSEWSRS